jgi:prevent-host-death family protein
MEQTMTATDARIRFGEVLRRVSEEGQRIIVERAGQPKAVIISVAEYERLKAAQSRRKDWKEQVRQSRERIRAELGERELPPPEEIIRQMREERSEQLTNLR